MTYSNICLKNGGVALGQNIDLGDEPLLFILFLKKYLPLTLGHPLSSRLVMQREWLEDKVGHMMMAIQAEIEIRQKWFGQLIRRWFQIIYMWQRYWGSMSLFRICVSRMLLWLPKKEELKAGSLYFIFASLVS